MALDDELKKAMQGLDSDAARMLADLLSPFVHTIETQEAAMEAVPLPAPSTSDAYDAVIAAARTLMLAKNHDYGESWRGMRVTSLTDIILNKAQRIKRLEDLHLSGESPHVSEGIAAEYQDILNYCVFALIKLREEAST